jgi:hypothetical protein
MSSKATVHDVTDPSARGPISRPRRTSLSSELRRRGPLSVSTNRSTPTRITRASKVVRAGRSCRP